MENTKEQIVEAIDENGIKDIDDAFKFLEEKEGAKVIKEVDWKWEIEFEGQDTFKFTDDEDLIEWCREQRDKYFED